MPELSEALKLLVLLAILVGIMGCGKAPDGMEEKLSYKETITCDTNDVCKGSTVTCVRESYYSQNWLCTVLINE